MGPMSVGCDLVDGRAWDLRGLVDKLVNQSTGKKVEWVLNGKKVDVEHRIYGNSFIPKVIGITSHSIRSDESADHTPADYYIY